MRESFFFAFDFVATHSGWLGSYRLLTQWELVIREERFWIFIASVGGTPPPLLLDRMFSSGSNYH